MKSEKKKKTLDICCKCEARAMLKTRATAAARERHAARATRA